MRPEQAIDTGFIVFDDRNYPKRHRRRRRRAAPDRPDPPPHRPALPRPQLQPGQLLLLLRPHRSAGRSIVAEVENIPWGERHAYVLERGDREGTVLAAELEKNHHVSPLMGMDQTYSFRVGTPGERLQIQIESRPREGGAPATSGGTATTVAASPKTFDATLSLRRRELSRPLMLGLLARYPANSLQTVAKIYVQAARLKLKGVRYYPHPEGAEVAR